MKIKHVLTNAKTNFLHYKTFGIGLLYFFISITLFSQTITFSANSMSGTVNNTNDVTRLVGDAFVKTDSIELNADEIELSGTDYRYVKASGNIKGIYTEAGFTFQCESITYDRDLEIAVLEGAVFMIDTENDVELKAAFVEYDQKTEVALIQIDVEIVKDDSICTSAFALYRKDIQILELSGSPKVTQGEDIFQSHEIIFNLDTEEITLVGNVQGTIVDSKGEDE